MRDDKYFSYMKLHDTIQAPFIYHQQNGHIRMRGIEAIDLINRLSTNSLSSSVPGDVVETIFTTEKGRIIDVILVLVKDDGLLLLTSPDKAAEMLEWLERYTIMEDIVYKDLSDEFATYWRFEEPSSAAQDSIGWKWENINDSGIELCRVRHGSLRGRGEVFIVPDSLKEDFLAKTTSTKTVTDEEFLLWRIQNGLPAVGTELNESVNPLESGAKAAVDFEKGCYIGQEVIARLDSYNKVQRTLRKIEFTSVITDAVQSGDPLSVDGKNAGFLTSVVTDPQKSVSIGLACVRTAYADAGTKLEYIKGETHSTLFVL